MRSKKVWRYYCEYCKKSGCNKFYLERHEKHCTMNPNRECRFCKIIEKEDDIEKLPMDKLIELVPDLDKLREATNNCPACILAAIRQEYIKRESMEEEEEFSYRSYIAKFDYKKEVDKFWADHNEAENEETYY